MPRIKKSEDVPKAMQDKFNSITRITDDFCKKFLNEEYAQLTIFATAALCRKRPSPLTKGKENTWACGIIHAIGMVNFLYDKSQEPYMSASDLYKEFGVSVSTGQAKSKAVRDTLRMSQLDSNWYLPSRLEDSMVQWMITVNGLIVDARQMPREFQEIAYKKGLIPYIPDDKKHT
jgi:hypothetical protein